MKHKKILEKKIIDELLEKDRAYKIPFGNGIVFVEQEKKEMIYSSIEGTNLYLLIKEYNIRWIS